MSDESHSKSVETTDGLELLRLRVLASRKRKDLENKEEGEISDSDAVKNRVAALPASFTEVPLRCISLPSHLSCRPSPVQYRRKREGGVGRRKGRVSTHISSSNSLRISEVGETNSPTTRFLESLTHELRPFSDSFSAQTCVVTIDSDSEDETVTGANYTSARTIDGLSEQVSSPELTALGPSPGEGWGNGENKIDELRLGELEKQKELLDTTRIQTHLIAKELKALDDQLKEMERVTKIAVEKQQKLKIRLKETKTLIHKSKQLKVQNLARQHMLRTESAQKLKLMSMLDGSINAKILLYYTIKSKEELTNDPTSSLSPSLPAIEELAITSDSVNSIDRPPPSLAVAAQNNSNEAVLSQRAIELIELEKRALKIQGDLVAAQISLLKNRDSQKKKVAKRSKKKSKSDKSSTALGKVMSINPFSLGSKFKDVDASVQKSVVDAKIDLVNYFPPFLFPIGEHLIDASTIIEMMSGVLRFLTENTTNEDASDNEEASAYVDDAGFGGDCSDIIEPALMFKPYLSPLRVFKTYRYSPYFAYSASYQGLLSPSFTNGVVPHQIVCPVELLNGQCYRRHCRGQHFTGMFLDDPSILEDFMISLLSMPISGGPFKDQLEVITEIKSKLLKLASHDLPLISLVGVLLDTFKRMNDSCHVISFCPRASPVAFGISVFKSPDRSKLHLKTDRSFFSGTLEPKEGQALRLSRYFASKKIISDHQSQSTVWEELFTIDGGTNQCPNHDLPSKARVVSDQNGAYPEPIDRNCLAWIQRLSRTRYDLDSLADTICDCLKESDCSSTTVDIIYATVRILGDHGRMDDAIAFLRGHCLDSLPNDLDVLPTGLGSILASSKSWKFSTIDTLYLTLLYLYVSETKAYPQRSFLSFPFEVVRRLDFYFLIPWTRAKSHEEDIDILQKVVSTLVAENVSYRLVDWAIANLINLVHDCYPRDHVRLSFPLAHQLSPVSRSRIMKYEFTNNSMARENWTSLAQSHPYSLLHFIGSIYEEMDKVDPKPETVKNILRVFWFEYFGQTIIDEQLVFSIASHLGFSNLFPVSHQIASSSMSMKTDPFIWIVAIISLHLLHQDIGSSLLASILEVAITNVGDTLSSMILLYLLAKISCPKSLSVPFVNRFLSVADDEGGMRRRPESTVEFQWLQDPWHESLTHSLDEFVELNIPSVIIGPMVSINPTRWMIACVYWPNSCHNAQNPPQSILPSSSILIMTIVII